MALFSTIHASRHKAQPTQSSELISGFSRSKTNAPSIGHTAAHAPHSGPE